LYDNHFHDAEIERLAHAQQRIVLTRDRELLKRRGISHGCYVRALNAEPQLREVFDRLDLARSARPFTRCLSCNGSLHPVDKAQIDSLLPPRVSERHDRFSRCDGCARIFWEGSHWRRMRELVDALLGART
jgi:uncharacterized protein